MQFKHFKKYICLIAVLGMATPLQAAGWWDSASSFWSSATERVSQVVPSFITNSFSWVGDTVRSAPTGVVIGVSALFGAVASRLFARSESNDEEAEELHQARIHNMRMMFAERLKKKDEHFKELGELLESQQGLLRDQSKENDALFSIVNDLRQIINDKQRLIDLLEEQASLSNREENMRSLALTLSGQNPQLQAEKFSNLRSDETGNCPNSHEVSGALVLTHELINK